MIRRKIFLFASDPNHFISLSVPALRGAYHDRHGRWAWDAVDAAASGAQVIAGRGFLLMEACERSTARRRTALMRTAKPCGPGTRCWCQVGGGFASPTGLGKSFNSPMTVTRRIRRRGEHDI